MSAKVPQPEDKTKLDSQKLIDALNAAAGFLRHRIVMPAVQDGSLLEKAAILIGQHKNTIYTLRGEMNDLLVKNQLLLDAAALAIEERNTAREEVKSLKMQIENEDILRMEGFSEVQSREDI